MNHIPASPAAAFAALALPAALQTTLTQLGHTTMTPIQAASLPVSLAGHDVIAQARTGSGKTAAFGLALLTKLLSNGAQGSPGTSHGAVQGLVLCPTRELAEQVAQELRRLARGAGNVKLLTLCGGAPLRPQSESLAHGADIVVGTPGRVLDHLGRGSLQLDQLATLVLDEADRMLDMGFVDDIARIAERCPAARQTLLFSATYPDAIAQLARRFMRQPRTVTVAEQHAPDSIRQRFFEVTETERLDAVSRLLRHYRPTSTLAFCNTKQQCRDLVLVLRAQGISALELHGDLDQHDRDQVLVRFANRSCSVLVATDVAARGLDIAQLEAVVNVDMSADPQVHLHRVGRTGRIGQASDSSAAGWALSLASVDEMGSVGRIDQLQGRESEWLPLASLHDDPAPLRPPMVTLQILGGRKEKIRAGDVLGALTGAAGFMAAQIGKIHVTDQSTYVAVEREIADDAVRRLSAGTLKGRRVKLRRMLETD